MADDVVALTEGLQIPKADVVGWSDGGIIGLDLAMRHKERIGKVFAFAANTVTAGVIEGVEKNPTFAAYIARAGREYEKYSPTPKEYPAFVEQISKMWADEPNWTDAQLKAINLPTSDRRWRSRRGDQARAYRIYRRHHPACRPGDFAQRQPFRLLAGSAAIQLRHSAFLGRRIAFANPTLRRSS